MIEIKSNLLIKIVSAGIAFLAVFSLSACQSITTTAAVQEPVITLQSVEIAGIDINGVQLLCKVEVNNPNPFDITFPETDWSFFINNNSFASGNIKNNQRIRARGSGIIEVPVSIDYINFFNSFRSFKGSKQAAYKLTLAVKIPIPVFEDRVWNLEYNGDFPLPQQPRFSSPSMRIENAGLNRADVVISINVENPNVFPLPAPVINYDFSINRNSFIRGEMANNRTLPPSSTTPLTLRLQISFTDLFRSFTALRNVREAASLLIFECDFGIPAFKGESLRFELPGSLPLPR